MSKVIKMKYQLADLVNGQYGEVFSDKEVADKALADAIAEGKRINLENSGGESEMGSWGGKPQSVEDFISLVEITDINDAKNVDVEVMLEHGFVVVRFEHDSTKFSMSACLNRSEDGKIIAEVDVNDTGMTWGNCGDDNGEAFEVFGEETATEWFMKQISDSVDLIE